MTAVLLAAVLTAAEPGDRRGVEFFEAKVRPVLAEHCLKCHAGDRAKGGLRLDTRAGVLAGGDSGPAVVPGRPDESPLVRAVEFAGELRMPPGKPLPPAAVADLRAWVARGAPDPRDRPAPVSAGPWALAPPKDAPPPAVRDPAWPLDPLDRFVLAKIEAAGLRPAADADRHALLRRLTFDLTGLPPTPEEVEAFVRDPAPDAYERVADRLLASPAFGERWGRHWLDVARYGESAGRTVNVAFPHAWRYRDYVIRSVNADVPFDRFVREQLAGDLLPAASPERRDEQVVATGFLAVGPKPFEEGGRAEKFRLEVADEQIDVIGRAVLGLTLACARCHDHKFDPLTRRDYYALAGALTSTDTLYGPGPSHAGHKIYGTPLAPVGPDAGRLHGPYQAYVDKLAAAKNAVGKAQGDRYRHVRALDSLELRRKAGAKDLDSQIAAEKAEVAAWDVKVAAAKKEVADLEKSPPPSPAYAMAARDAAKPADTPVRSRGDWDKPEGGPVPRGVPPSLAPAVPVAAHESGRRQLAEWATRADNPLTPRVFANRAWQHLFGAGLARTPDNFGATGEPPTHPELLDRLALDFVRAGWSVKVLVRRLVLSRAYRVGADRALAAADPDNRLFARRPPRPLEAEPLRDALLAAAGTLDRAPAASRVREAKADSAGSLEGPVPGDNDRPVRAVYLAAARAQLPEMLPLFDAPDPSLVIARRDRRTLPQQALYLLNSPFVAARARELAGRLLARPGDAAGRVDDAYRLCYGRPASADEVRRALDYVGPSGGPDAWAELARALFASAEFRHVD